MTIKITGGGFADINKAVRSQTNSFELNDITPIVQRQEAEPALLTAMFGGTTNSVFMTTNKIDYDELDITAQLPSGKRFEEFGPDLQKDLADERTYRIGSFGIRANVSPKDYAGRRLPGTANDYMDEAYLVAQMNTKMQRSFRDLDELAMAQIITADTNIIQGGPQPQYNFYTDIIGSARPAPMSLDYANSNLDHFQRGVEQLDLLEQDIERTMNNMTMPVMICGKNFFQQRLFIEKQQGGGGSLNLARDSRSRLDLATMGVPEENFGSGSGEFPYQYFDSHDGIRYVRYAASIQGTKLIADDNGYLLPIGAERFLMKAYAPAQTREYVNTTAQSMYGWSNEDDRNGVTMWAESNFLTMNVNPQLIRHYTV